MRELTFRHGVNRTHAPALDRVALMLRAGRRYALIGASGSGKTTLLRVLAGLHVCERIVLTCDDQPLLASPAEAARTLRFGATLIPQDAEVLAGSVAENLALCESVSGPPEPAQYLQALRAACATDFITAGARLETRVAERAANWSGGQRARLALARGILAAQGSALVLLDEPTASLDPATEKQVYANLFATFADACVVVCVHRLNLLGRFDEVLLMHGGHLLMQGNPAALAGSHEFERLIAASGRADEYREARLG